MISNRSGRTAALTTAMLLERHPSISLETIEGSPLDQLVAASDDGIKPEEGMSLESLVDDIREVSMVQDLRDGSTHDLVMEESVDVVAGSIRNTVDFTRTVLNPAANLLDSQVREALTNFSPIRFFVEPYFFKPIFASQILIDSVGRFDNAPEDAGSLKRLALPSLDDVSLTEMLRTGMPEWDGLIIEFLAAKPEGWLAAVYDSLFGKGTDSLLIPDTQLGVTWGGIDRKANIRPLIGREDYLLAGYLLATALLAKPDASANLSLADWRDVLSTWVQQLGRGIVSVQRVLASRIRSGLMVLSYPSVDPIWKTSPADAKIVVLGNVYNKWLEAGGSPEVLIGAMFTRGGNPPVTATDLMEIKDACISAYGQYERALDYETKSRATDTIRNAFATAVALSVVNAADADLGGRTKADVQQEVTQYLDRVADWGSVDIFRLGREILGNVVYNCPMGMRLLERIDEVTEGSDRSPQEAAYIALEELVSTYVSNQTQVKMVV